MLTSREPSVNTASTCNSVIHVGDALHDIFFGQHGCGVLHDLFHGLAFACAFERGGGDVGYRLGIIEFKPFFLAAFGYHAERKEHQFVDFSWCQMHILECFYIFVYAISQIICHWHRIWETQ